MKKHNIIGILYVALLIQKTFVQGHNLDIKIKDSHSLSIHKESFVSDNKGSVSQDISQKSCEQDKEASQILTHTKNFAEVNGFFLPYYIIAEICQNEKPLQENKNIVSKTLSLPKEIMQQMMKGKHECNAAASYRSTGTNFHFLKKLIPQKNRGPICFSALQKQIGALERSSLSPSYRSETSNTFSNLKKKQIDEPFHSICLNNELSSPVISDYHHDSCCAQPSYVDPCCNIRAYLIPYYTWAFGKTVGIEDDYQMLGGFVGIPNVCNTALGIIQADVLYLEKDLWAGSIGAGMRLFDQKCWGVNLFYDYRKGDFGSFHQIGVGCESLYIMNCFDLRANAYFPLSSTKDGDTSFYFFPEGSYQASYFESDIAMYAANGEIGAPFCLSSCYGIDSYVAIGPYFLAFPDENAMGVRFRTAITYLDYIWLELFTTYDQIFGTLVQGQLTLSFPFQVLCGCFFDSCGAPRCCPNPPIIDRFDAIAVHRCCNWSWSW